LRVGELRGRAFLAYLIVCIVWGSTFLGIRIGVQGLPPFLLAGVRFTLAGLILAGIARLLGQALPTRKQDWVTLGLVGVLLLTSGNGLVVWAEQYLDAGTASIYVVTVAIWAACFDALMKGGTTPFTWRLAVGLLLGLAGTAVLTGATPTTLLHTDFRGPAALVFASGSWAWGSVYLKRHPVKVSFSMSAAVQMVIGGVALLLVGAVRGEAGAFHPTLRPMLAVAYLIVMGSIVGFTAYGYALRHASATVVGTYAYVNPVVAVILGGLLLHEPIGARKIVAMAIILGAVLWIQRVVRAAAPKRAASASTREGKQPETRRATA
jgi:drug/metabolite transporter (DMT)-like permease